MEKVIIWDLGGVVVFVDEEKLPFEYYSNNKIWDEFEKGKITEQQFFNYCSATKEEFNDIFSTNEFVVNLIKSLTETQYYLSNTNVCHFEYLKSKLDILNTDNLFLSFKMGVRKPDEEIYRLVNESLSDKQIYYIDDRELNLIHIPLELGWKTFLYTGKNNSDLEAFVNG